MSILQHTYTHTHQATVVYTQFDLFIRVQEEEREETSITPPNHHISNFYHHTHPVSELQIPTSRKANSNFLKFENFENFVRHTRTLKENFFDKDG